MLGEARPTAGAGRSDCLLESAELAANLLDQVTAGAALRRALRLQPWRSGQPGRSVRHELGGGQAEGLKASDSPSSRQSRRRRRCSWPRSVRRGTCGSRSSAGSMAPARRTCDDSACTLHCQRHPRQAPAPPSTWAARRRCVEPVDCGKRRLRPAACCTSRVAAAYCWLAGGGHWRSAFHAPARAMGRAGLSARAVDASSSYMYICIYSIPYITVLSTCQVPRQRRQRPKGR